MRVLVLGGGGMAGHMISLYFKERGYDVTALTIRPFPLCHNILVDVLDTKNLEMLIHKGNYDVIINCVGILNQFAEENPYLAECLNSKLPHFIVEVIRNIPCRLIHMSTDCVFAGNSGPYRENSIKDGMSIYDRTKAAGEINDGKNLTFRNSIIGPDMKENGIGLFNWFMKQTGDVNGYTRAIWTGVTTLTLAKAMEQAIKQNLTGVYNLVNNESISKYDLLLLFNKHCKKNKVQILPSEKVCLDKSLICTRTDFNFCIPSYEQMIIEMKEWIDNHQYVYPNYYYL